MVPALGSVTMFGPATVRPELARVAAVGLSRCWMSWVTRLTTAGVTSGRRPGGTATSARAAAGAIWKGGPRKTLTVLTVDR
jgi:hypothetical protein